MNPLVKLLINRLMNLLVYLPSNPPTNLLDNQLINQLVNSFIKNFAPFVRVSGKEPLFTYRYMHITGENLSLLLADYYTYSLVLI